MRRLIPTYRIEKPNGEHLYNTTSLKDAKEFKALLGYSYYLLPNGYWISA